MRFSPLSRWCAVLLAATMATPVGLLRAQAKPAAGAPSQAKPPTTVPPKSPPATTVPPKTPAATVPPKTAPAATATPPPGTNADTGWPRTIALNSGTAIWYQPQIDNWTDQKKIVAWSAVAFHPTGAKEPALGTIKIEGDTAVAVDDRVVRLDLSITEYNFKTLAPNIVKSLVSDVQALPQNERVLDLDRLLAYTANSPLKVKETEGIKADPPLVFSAPAPAILINLDGAPIWSPIKDVDLRYALNTNWDLFEHQPSKTFYLRNNASWLQAPSVVGPWTAVTGKLPDSFAKLPADDNWKEVKAALPGQKLNDKTTPKVFVSTVPAELILLEGPTQLRVGPRGDVLALGEQHRSRRVPDDPRRRLLLPGRWPLVQRAEPRRARGPLPRRSCRRTSRRSRSSIRARACWRRFQARRRPSRPWSWPPFHGPRG